MFDQIEPRTLNSVQLTDAAIKPNCTANITALLLLAIEPIIDLSPTRKKLSDETKQQKKEQKRQIMSIFACLIPSVVSSDGLFVSGKTWKDKNGKLFSCSSS